MPSLRALPGIVLCFLSLACSTARHPLIVQGPTVQGKAVVVSVSAPASRVGAETLARGGNAVDAAVATAFALAVTFPEAGNIGGGGFMLVHFPDGRDPAFVDYRETAPASMTTATFARKEDRTPQRLVGIPGTVRGLALARDKFGKLPWRDLVLPAVALARDGFALDQDGADALNRVLTANKDKAELQRVFGKPDHSPWRAGDRLVQGDLAKTLQQIADGGPDAFYSGPIADAITAEMKRGGGLITFSDLSAYQAQFRGALRGTYLDYTIHTAPPPSSGGTAILEMLNILETFDLRKNDRFSAPTLHLITEAMRRAFADRAKYLGDPAFVKNPPYLTTKEYAKKLAATIDPDTATPSLDLAGDVAVKDEPQHTTHFSVVDEHGMAVSNTYTLEESFGGKLVVPGCGFLLNNELGDFNPQPGVTTKTGQIGTPPNLPFPGKRPLSSMCPTIVTKDGQPVLITGSPGGRTIINTVLCVLVNRLAYHMPPRETIDAPRQHEQWLPDRLTVEPALAKDHGQSLDTLRAMGHTIDPTPRRQGDAHSIFYDPSTKSWIGVADRRRSGSAAGLPIRK
jgi:gamma-glutamyltranspeptidase/glutathione hydrolase